MSTVQLHRVIQAPVEKVFRAFADPLAQAFWFPPYGFLCEVHQMDFRLGGTFKMSFHNFTTQQAHSFGGSYLQLKENEIIQYSDRFDDPNLPGEMTTTVQFKVVSCGTEINITQEGIPEMIPVEMCYLGWQESLDKLIKLVTPVINE